MKVRLIFDIDLDGPWPGPGARGRAPPSDFFKSLGNGNLIGNVMENPPRGQVSGPEA